MPSTALVELFLQRRSSLRCAAATAIVVLAAATPGCGKPFNVKAQPDLPPANYASKATAGSVSVQAQAVTDEDFLYDTFDANLVLAGVLSIRVMLTNSGRGSVDLKDVRFEMRAREGRSFKAMKEPQAFKRLISYYQISAYGKAGYKESLDAFSAYALDIKTPLAAGQSRQGLVFFSVPNEAARGAGLMLIVSKLDATRSASLGVVELKLD